MLTPGAAEGGVRDTGLGESRRVATSSDGRSGWELIDLGAPGRKCPALAGAALGDTPGGEVAPPTEFIGV